MKIAFLIVATHKYIRFVQPLYDSMKAHLKIASAKIDMFVFTNQSEVPTGCIKVFQEHKPFPYPTLMRYHIFDKNKDLYKDYDYLYYLDADMLFAGEVGSEILTSRLGVLHPGFYNKQRDVFSYETRKESTAYVAPHEGTHYFCGGFNGGEAKVYLEMCRVISNNVNMDEAKGIMAIWHDESHLNRYYASNLPTKILSPSYCYPGEEYIRLSGQIGLKQFPSKILALDKNKNEVRN